jgi:small-conductance mechanosensitive channel
MNSEIQHIWQEILADINTPSALWQMAIIALAIGTAFAVNGALRTFFYHKLPENVRPVLGAINRILFPISALLIVVIARYICDDWMHVSMLRLASRLLLAMAIIRLMVYGIRYVFAPSGWLKALEHLIAWTVWIMLALHLSGLLPEISSALESIKFTIGKSPVNLLIILQGIITVLITIFLALWLSQLIENKVMAATQININLRVVLTKLVRIAFIFLAVLIALSAVGLDITLLSVFGGALGVGLGFGLQKIASNYISGFILLMDRSIQIGDLITIETHYGMVKELHSRFMTLRKLDGTEVIIPNEMMITGIVINHTSADHHVRVQMPIQVAYDTDLEVAIDIMKNAAIQHQRVLKTDPINVLVRGFGESGIDLQLSFWIGDPEEGSAILQSDIYQSIWKAFNVHGISIPYPQREVKILNQDKLA